MKNVPLISLLIAFLLYGCIQNKTGQSSSQNLTIKDSTTTQPSFPGGMEAFGKFLGKNLKWPLDEVYIHGKVIVSFYVETNGSLSNFKVEKKVWPEIDAEALRVLKLSPKWIPAMQNGKAIRKKYLVPINFTLGE